MRIIYTLCLVFSCLSLFAQISISKFSLPSQGETLKTYTSLATDINLGVFDGPQTWDFTSLSTDNYNETELLDPSLGSQFVANADFLIKTGDFVEQFYNKTDESITEIFLKTLDPIFNEFEITNYYADPPVYRKGTIVLYQNYNNQSKFQAALAWDALPDTITAGIGLPIDSIRINTNFNRNDYIDGYGTVQLPDANWEALRESTTTIRTITIDVFFFGNWIEAPAEVLETFLGDFGDLLAPDTTYSTNFYAEGSIEVLAAFTQNDNNEPQTCTYKAGSEITNTDQITLQIDPQVKNFPNPSYGNITFDFQNFSSGEYNLEIYNVLGRKMWNKSIFINSPSSSREIDFSTILNKGTYFYNISDSSGKAIATKRIIIVTP